MSWLKHEFELLSPWFQILDQSFTNVVLQNKESKYSLSHMPRSFTLSSWVSSTVTRPLSRIVQPWNWHTKSSTNETVSLPKASKGHFTHKTESPWPLHFKHSYWWKRRTRSKFTSHHAWGTVGVYECKMDVKARDHGILNAHTIYLSYFYQV